MIAPDGQAKAAIEVIQQLRPQITSRDVELSVLQQGDTDRNSEVVRSQAEIERLEERLQKLENDSSQRPLGKYAGSHSQSP